MRLLSLFFLLLFALALPCPAAEMGLFDLYITQNEEPLRAKKLQHFKDVGLEINFYKENEKSRNLNNTLERVLLLRLDKDFTEHYTPKQYKDLVSVLLKSRCPVPLQAVQTVIHHYQPGQHDPGYIEVVSLCLRDQRVGLHFRKVKRGGTGSNEILHFQNYMDKVQLRSRELATPKEGKAPHDVLYENTLLMDLCDKGLFEEALLLLNAGISFNAQRHYKIKAEQLPDFPSKADPFNSDRRGIRPDYGKKLEEYRMSMKKLVDIKHCRNALLIACRTPHGNPKLRDQFLEALLKRAKKEKNLFFINDIDPEDEMTALDYACSNDVDASIIRLMIDMGMEGAAYYSNSTSVKSPWDHAEESKREDLRSILSRYGRNYINSGPSYVETLSGK